MRVERQTLWIGGVSWLVLDGRAERSRKQCRAATTRSAYAHRKEGVDIRLVLALGTSEPCYSAEDDDEDDAHEEAPAVAKVSTNLRSLDVC
jgi:hypothetical protein